MAKPADTYRITHTAEVEVAVDFPAGSEPNEEQVVLAIETVLEDAEPATTVTVDSEDEDEGSVEGRIAEWRIR